jgi:adenosylcobinamide-phosphate synthase
MGAALSDGWEAMAAALTLAALLIELMVGYPDRLFRTIGHPVTWMGALIGLMDRGLNRSDDVIPVRRMAGAITLAVLISSAGVIALLLDRGVDWMPFIGSFLVALVASTLLAQRSLHAHVSKVAAALDAGGLPAGREAVSHIVGRDTAALDQAGVARAAIESLAENFSDGVVAPAFWMGIAGLPGAAIYKAINTADSMIGHRTERHEAFGWAAARLDDLVNLIPARLSALLIVAAAAMTDGASAANAWRAVRRDARRHRSPNAGYPEAAMAGALGLKLAGPRSYAGVSVEDVFMGDGRRDAHAADIRAALALYRRADALLIVLVAAIALVLIATG